MAITHDEAIEALQEFVSTYPEAYKLRFIIGETVDDIYGKSEVIKQHIPEGVKGGHISGKTEESGVIYMEEAFLIL